MVAKKDAQFQSSVIGIRKSFEKTTVLSTDFNFDFVGELHRSFFWVILSYMRIYSIETHRRGNNVPCW